MSYSFIFDVYWRPLMPGVGLLFSLEDSMRRKVILLSAAGMTFIVGVISATVWFQFSDTRSTSQQPHLTHHSLRGSERMHACLKRFDINLGDSFQHVKSLISLSANPNGPNQNIDWRQGELTDFFTVPEQQIEIDKENKLQPVIFCTFDDQKRLQSFSISWSLMFISRGLNEEESNSLKRKIIEGLINSELKCMARIEIDLKKSSFKSKSDFGDYIREFEYDFSNKDSFWRVSYSVKMK